MTVNQDQIQTAPIQDLAGEQQLFISGRIWHELYPKVDPGLFLKVLREQIDLRNYGEGITKFYFTFVVLEKITPNFSNWVGSDYYPDKASVDIGIRIPFQDVVEADEETVIKLMEKALLEGIDTIGEHDITSSFDHEAFKADVEVIFENSDWYVTE
ncbi:MAG: hypothetical protein AAFP77_18205 [Bacteroidota bacterium]